MKALFLCVALFLSINLAFAKKQTLIFCSEASPSNLNSLHASDQTSMILNSHVVDTLVKFKPGGTEIVPHLAKSWKVSKDEKTYTFKLRKNVAFHSAHGFKPTRTMNADDVVFSLNRLVDKNHPFHMMGGGAYPIFRTFKFDSLITKV